MSITSRFFHGATRQVKLISQRALKIPVSQTLAVSSAARRLIADGKDVIDFGIGEPDILAPQEVREAVARYASKGHKIYSYVEGMPEVLSSVVGSVKRDYGLTFRTDQVMCFDGGKNGLDRVFETILDPGDEVIIPTPGWVSYEAQVLLAGGAPVFVYCGMDTSSFKITPEQLHAAMTPNTKAFVICPLNNPTGIAYTKDELLALGAVLREFPDVLIISDDLYQHMHFSRQFYNIAQCCPDLADRVILVNGTTKSYSWRFGYVAAMNSDLIKYMKVLQAHRGGHPNLEMQAGAVAALEMDPQLSRIKVFKERHDFLLPLLNDIPGWKVIPGDGAFYFLIDVRQNMKERGIRNDVDYATAILRSAEVALVPGSAFGAPGHLRLAYAQPIPRLQEALDRIFYRFILDNTAMPRIVRQR